MATTFNSWMALNAIKMMQRLSLYIALDEDAFQDAYVSLAMAIKGIEQEAMIERKFVAEYKRISGKHINEAYQTINPEEIFFNLLPADVEDEDAEQPKPTKNLAYQIKRYIRASFPRLEVMAWEMRLDGNSYRDITDSIGMSREKIIASGSRIATLTRKAFPQVI